MSFESTDPAGPEFFEPCRTRSQELMDAYFEDRLTEGETAELLELWRKYPELREEAGDRYEIEHDLTFLARLEKHPPTFRFRDSEKARLAGRKPVFDTPLLIDEAFNPELLQILQSIRADYFHAADQPTNQSEPASTESATLEDPLQAKPSLSPQHAKPDVFRQSRWLICLVATLFCIGVYTEFRSVPVEREPVFVEPAFLAEVVAAVDVRVAPGDPSIKQGLRLETDRLRFESGTVELLISNGVRLVLEGPADFKLNSPLQTLCNVGRVSASVPPEGKGFEVATPHLTVRDLGTDFFVNVTREESEVHVVKGEVVTNWFNLDWIPFNTGQAMRIDSTAGKPTRFIAEPALFVGIHAMRQRLEIDMRRRTDARELENRRRDNDPDLIFSLDQATLHGCDAVPGAHPENRAVQFRSARNYGEMTLSGEHRNLTLVAVARLDAMRHFGALLCVGDGFPDRPGEFVWQFERSGELLFHIRGAGGVNTFDAPPHIKPGAWKTWLHLAVVADADAREIRHYVDGQRIAALPWTEPVPLQMQRGTLGNDHPDKRKKTVRFWNGDFDTFDVYSRALSDDAVAAMYENVR